MREGRVMEGDTDIDRDSGVDAEDFAEAVLKHALRLFGTLEKGEWRERVAYLQVLHILKIGIRWLCLNSYSIRNLLPQFTNDFGLI